jgi:hypothetical protein
MNEPGWPHGNRPAASLLWELWKPGYVMSCEMNEHPLGWELRCYMRGDFHHSQILPSPDLAREEAEAKMQEFVGLGWTRRPTIPW